MRDNDIIEKIHKIYDQKEPDVLSKLDFSRVEMKSAPEKSVRRRYISAAAIYAAACLAVIIILPFLIGGGGDAPKPVPSNSAVSSETVVTGDERTTPEVWLYLSQNFDPFYGENEIGGGTADEEEEFRALYESNVSEAEFGRIETLKAVTPREIRLNTGYRLFEVNDDPTTYLMYEDTIVRLYSDSIKRLAAADANSDGKYELYFYGGTSSGFGRPMLWFDPVSKKVENVTVDYDGEIEISFQNYIFDLPENGKLRARIINSLRVMPGGKVYLGEFTDNGMGEAVFKITEVRDATQDDMALWQKEMGITETSPEDTEVSGTTEATGSIDVYPIPAESAEDITEPESEPETVAPDKQEPETSRKPSVAEHAVSTSKRPIVSETTTTVATTAAPETENPVKVYPDPADHVRVRFFKDTSMTEEYSSAADIPYGAKVYYIMENDPGYIFTNLSMNVYEFGLDPIWKDTYAELHHYFINEYHGDKLEYSYTAVLAGDADGNLYYDMNDAETLQKYLDGDAETRYYYGMYGYSERLDYTCDGFVTEHDLTGLLAEIENGDAERNTMSMHNYSNDAGSRSYLLNFDDAVVLPHGRDLNSIETDGAVYSVYKDASEISDLSDEIKAKYDDEFFVSNDLVLVYCYTEDGDVPTVDELYELWCTKYFIGSTLNPVYSDDNAGQTLSEYAICIELSNSDVSSESETPAETEPEETTRPTNGLVASSKIYSDPANASKIRFFKDKEMTEEYESYYEIPYTSRVYYKIESDPGYICTNLKMNVYEFYSDTVYENGVHVTYNYFINNYSREGRKYSLTTVLAGDSDQNLKYNLKDVSTMLRYIAKWPSVKYEYGNTYSARLDYNCDGRVNMMDVAGILKEIAGWDIERACATEDMYNYDDVFSVTHLIPRDGAQVMVHGIDPNEVETNGWPYYIFRDVVPSHMTEELQSKYDTRFFESYDLVMVFCYTSEGAVPKASDLTEIWYDTDTDYLTPVFEETDYTGTTLSEYAICIPVMKKLSVNERVPV